MLVPIPPVPGSTSMGAAGINDLNQIAGTFGTSDNLYHGFVGDLNGNYVTFDASAGGTSVHALNNNGYVTGGAFDNPDDFVGKAFVRKPNGAIKLITKDGSAFDGYGDGITNKAVFVGSIYQFADSRISDLLYELGYYGKGHAYQADLVLPFNTYQTRPRGINRYGEVIGYYTDVDHAVNGSYPTSGFVLKNGVATRVVYPDPNAFYVFLNGLNDKGKIVGAWLHVDQTPQHAFVYDFERNRFKLIDVPGETRVTASGINNSGVVTVSAGGKAYIYCPKKKTCPIQSPSAIEVPERWISAAGYPRTVPCKNGCKGPFHPSRTQLDPAAVREAITRDPEIQRELRLPFRP
ncbi:MAG: hypothetical protein JO056_08130 [Alphaproteobacteria bacterium]|nr:hypothetical protein [Alphaproteobacteria bacterium]